MRKRMDEKELKQRTKQFALRVIALVEALPATAAGRALGNQLIRSGTSVGANYRAACRGRSRAEFIAKLGIVEEEVDESAYWLELITEGDLLPLPRVQPLLQESGELTAIFAASIRSARRTAEQTLARKSLSIRSNSEIQNPPPPNI